MKREHNIEELPFYENLVFYAPLSKDDISDWISGNEFALSGNGTAAWDDNYSAYRITTPATKSRFVMSIDVDLDILLTNNSEYTIFAKIHPVGTLPSVNEPYIGLGDWNSTSFKPHINSSDNFVQNITDFNNSAYEGLDNNGNGRICRYYVKNYNEYTAYTHASCPAQWNSTNRCKNMICVGINRNGSSMTFLVKDIMVFNRMLTQEEINKL